MEKKAPYLVIEMIDPTKGIHNFFSFKTNQCKIGRSYSNDIILSDPYAASFEAIISLENGIPYLFIPGDKNKTNSPISTSQSLISGDYVNFGRTKFRILNSGHSPETRQVHSIFQIIINGLGGLKLVACCVFFLLLICSAKVYFDTYILFEFSLIVEKLIYYIVIILGYALLASLLARTFKQEPHFLKHLGFICAFSIIYLITRIVDQALLFNSSSQAVKTFIALKDTLILVPLFCFVFFELTLNITQVKLKIVFISFLSCFYFYSTYYDALINTEKYISNPSFSTMIYPKFFLIKSSITVDEHINDSNQLFD